MDLRSYSTLKTMKPMIVSETQELNYFNYKLFPTLMYGRLKSTTKKYINPKKEIIR